MGSGILAGVFWALETVILGLALSSAPFLTTAEAAFLSPFVCTFLHDLCSAVWMTGYNAARRDISAVFRTLRTRSGRLVLLSSVIGGPIGMTGYVLAIRYMGASVGAVASAAFPAIGAVLSHIFLKDKLQWYRWVFLLLTLGGVYALSFSPELDVKNFWLGVIGVLMCAFGWGIEAVLLARCLRGSGIPREHALQLRQTTSALVYGAVLLPALRAWPLTVSLFSADNRRVLLYIALAALCATLSYLCYYRAIRTIGAPKAMALDVTYAAWAIVFAALFARSLRSISPLTALCAAVVLVCGILTAADFRKPAAPAPTP